MLHHSDYRIVRQGVCEADVYDDLRIPHYADDDAVEPDSTTDYKVRYQIRCDTSYPDQSSGKVSVWNPATLSWNEVARFAPEERSYSKAREAAIEAQNTLECLARAILA